MSQTRLALPVQDNSGADVHSIPYIAAWERIRRRLNGSAYDCAFRDVQILAIALRIGGRFGDFDKGDGLERRRISRRSGHLSCDLVVQADMIARLDPGLGQRQAFHDFRAGIEYLLSHPACDAQPLCRQLIATTIENRLQALESQL